MRGIAIAAMGLDDTPKPPATKEAVRAVVRRINMLQIDSISVVARAPYFVVWSHVGDYDPKWLDELLGEAALFEHYASANCLLPIEDYPYFLKGSRIFEWRNPRVWLDEHSDVERRVLNYLSTYGEAKHTDFKREDGEKTTWTNPKQEQTALWYLLYTGELMVKRRDNLQAVFDLRERIYPEADNLPPVTREEAHDHFVLNAIRALGVAKEDWIGWYYRLKNADAKAAIKRVVKADRVIMVDVEGWQKPGYVHPDNLALVDAAADGHIPQSKTTILNPFDPMVSDRGRVLDVFDFDYPLEYYFPEEKRRFGYFSMPILYENRLIGRIDPKVYRQEGYFEVKSLHLEPGINVDETMVAEIKGVLQACATWHDTPYVIVRSSSEPGLAELLSD